MNFSGRTFAGRASGARALAAQAFVAVLTGCLAIGFAATEIGAQEPPPTSEKRQTAEKSGATIQWTPVPGAREYLFEVRDAKKAAVLRRTVKRPEILLKLPEGSYEMRSRAVDRFRRRTPWSDWAPLRIRYAIPPSIVSVKTEEYAPESATDARVIELRGKNFMQQSEVQVSVGPKTVPVSAVNFVSADTLRFELPADAPPGQYDVLVVNPGDARARLAAAFRLKGDGSPDGQTDRPPPDRAEPGANAEANREGLPRELTDPGFSGLSLLPGLPDFQSGRYIRGSLWAGAFLGATFAAFGGYQTAASASSGALSNPLYPSFSNPLYLFGLLNFGTGDNAGFYLYNTTEIFNNVQSEYNAGRTQYTTFGGAALIVYITHLALHSFSGPALPDYEGASAASARPGVSVWMAPAESLQSAADRSLGVRPQSQPDIRFAWSLSF